VGFFPEAGGNFRNSFCHQPIQAGLIQRLGQNSSMTTIPQPRWRQARDDCLGVLIDRVAGCLIMVASTCSDSAGVNGSRFSMALFLSAF